MNEIKVKQTSKKTYDRNRLLKIALINCNNNKRNEWQTNDSIKRLVLSLFFILNLQTCLHIGNMSFN